MSRKTTRKLKRIVDKVVDRGDSQVEEIKEAEAERFLTIYCPVCEKDHYKLEIKTLDALLKDNESLTPSHLEPLFDRKMYPVHNTHVHPDCVMCGYKDLFKKKWKGGKFTFMTREKGAQPKNVNDPSKPGVRIRRCRLFDPRDSAYRLRRAAAGNRGLRGATH